MSKTHKIKFVQPDSGMSCELQVSLAPVKVTIEPWDNFVDISGIAEKFFGKDIAYECDKLAENMTLKDGIITMPKEDNNSSHEPIEYEIGLTSETDYVPIKIIWKGQYPTIRKKNLEGEWEEEYDLVQVGTDHLPGDKYYYKRIGSTVGKVGLTNLVEEKEIPQDLLKYAHNVTEFAWVFGSHLTSIPEGLFDNCPKVTSFNETFISCTSITSIPEGLFDNCPKVTSFNETFSGCTSITSIPEGLFDNCPKVTSFNETFSYNIKLSSIPEGLFNNCPNVSSFESTFSQCNSITTIPEGLFNNCPNVSSFESTFWYCSSITTIPEGLFNNCPKVTSFHETFYFCGSLTGSTPTVTTKDGNRYKLWELAGKPGYPSQIDGKLCFTSCNNLDDYDDIPEYWKYEII